MPTEFSAETHPQHTRRALAQMVVVVAALLLVGFWQWEVVRHLYLLNQVNAVGWVVNGGIMALFLCGLATLAGRFFEYRRDEIGMARMARNMARQDEPLRGVHRRTMAARRYEMLRDLSRRRAVVQQNVLAATLLARESSRNSFLKFVHNMLILTGVFGTIVSLSLALFGVADMIHATAQGVGQSAVDGTAGNAAGGGLGVMIFGMSTALSTTMTAILAYLIFGYFYIRLTDAQTYLISRVEEVTAITLLPYFQAAKTPAARLIEARGASAEQLTERLAQSRLEYESAALALLEAAQPLARGGEQQARLAEQNHALLAEAVALLREGFRLDAAPDPARPHGRAPTPPPRAKRREA